MADQNSFTDSLDIKGIGKSLDGGQGGRGIGPGRRHQTFLCYLPGPCQRCPWEASAPLSMRLPEM